MDFTLLNVIWLLVHLSIRMALYHVDHSVLRQGCDKKVKKEKLKHIRYHRFPRKYVYITTRVNRIARPRIKEYIYKLCRYTENGLCIYRRPQNCYCFAIPFTSDSRENSWRPVIRLGTTQLDNSTPIVRSESQENREQHIEDLLRISNITGQGHQSEYPIGGSLYIDNNRRAENPENEACGGPLSEHSVPLSESNVSTIPGFPSFPSSAFPSPNSNYISTELNNSFYSPFEEATPAISGENSRMVSDDDLGTNQQTEKTSVPATMAFKLHSNQDNRNSSYCRFCHGKLRNVGASDDTPEQQRVAGPKTDKKKTSAHKLENSEPVINIRERRSQSKRTKGTEKTSDCDTNMQECTTELSNTQTGSAMQLSGVESSRGDESTNAEYLTSFLAVNIKGENPAHLRPLIEKENSSTRNTRSKSNPPTSTKEKRFNEKGIKDEGSMPNHALPNEMEPENVEGRRVVSSERPNVATERNLNAPSEENTLAIAEFDNIDQRMTVDRRVSRSISDNNSSDVIQTLEDKE